MSQRAYRATPGCPLDCPRCEVRCAVATRMRDDLLDQLTRAEKALREFRPAFARSFSRHH